MDGFGYVVLEWNQASHQPIVYGSDVYGTRADAEVEAQYWRDRLIQSGSGRRERYTVAELVELNEDE
jgi:hypothetical protein